MDPQVASSTWQFKETATMNHSSAWPLFKTIVKNHIFLFNWQTYTEPETQDIFQLKTFSSATRSLFYKKRGSIFVCQGKPNHQSGTYRTRYKSPRFSHRGSKNMWRLPPCPCLCLFSSPIIKCGKVIHVRSLNVPCKLFFYPKNYQKSMQCIWQGRQITEREQREQLKSLDVCPADASKFQALHGLLLRQPQDQKGPWLLQFMMSHGCTMNKKALRKGYY